MVFFLTCIILMVKSFDPDKIYGVAKGEIVITSRGGFTYALCGEMEKAVKEADEGAVIHATSMNRMTIDDDLYSVYTYLKEEDYFNILSGRHPKYDNEIMLTDSLSELLGKKPWDTVRVAYNGRKEEFVVTGLYQYVGDFGLTAMVTREGMEKLDFRYVSYCQLKLGSSGLEDMTEMLNERFGEKIAAEKYVISESDKKYRDLIAAIMHSLVYAMYVIIMVFSAVVVAMACRRAFIRERTDIGIFRAMGFTSRDLRIQFALRFMLTLP